MTWRLALLTLFALAWLGCPSSSHSDGGTSDGGSSDGGSSDGGSSDGGSSDAGITPPITLTIGDGGAPYDTWTWYDVPGTQCANGTPTGFAINPHAGSTNVTVYFEGGGACWTDATCITHPTASFLDGFDGGTFASNHVADHGLFNRTADNPLGRDNFVYVPYCTGDIHGGSNLGTYHLADGGTAQLHHVGFTNGRIDLSVIHATWPTPARLVISGASAGGFGTLFQYGPWHDAYPGVPAFLVDDSGPALPDAGAEYDAMNEQWHDFANFPAGCALCQPRYPDGGAQPGGGIKNIYAFYGRDPSFRGSLLETTNDNTIMLFFANNALLPFAGDEDNDGCLDNGGVGSGIGPGPCDFSTRLQQLYMDDILPISPGKMRVLIKHATYHTILGNPTGEVKRFLGAQLGQVDAGAWDDIVPYP